MAQPQNNRVTDTRSETSLQLTGTRSTTLHLTSTRSSITRSVPASTRLDGLCSSTRVWITSFVLLTCCCVSLAGTQEDGADTRWRRFSARDVTSRLVVTTILKEPYMMLKKPSMGSFLEGNDRFEGFMADILRNLSQAIGFDYKIELCLEGKTGHRDHEGRWNGMIGQIQQGLADVAVGAITITPERRRAVDFTESFMVFRSTALIRKPESSQSESTGQIGTAEELLQSNMCYVTEEGSIVQDLLQTSQDPLHRRMWARMQNFFRSAVPSVEAGVQLARTDNYAFLLDTPQAEYISGREPCAFYTIEPFLTTRNYGIALRKGDKLREVINRELRHMRDRQILSEFYLKWWRSSCDLFVPTKRRNSSSAPHQNGDGPIGETEKLGQVRSGVTSHYGYRAGVVLAQSLVTLLVCCLL